MWYFITTFKIFNFSSVITEVKWMSHFALNLKDSMKTCWAWKGCLGAKDSHLALPQYTSVQSSVFMLVASLHWDGFTSPISHLGSFLRLYEILWLYLGNDCSPPLRNCLYKFEIIGIPLFAHLGFAGCY